LEPEIQRASGPKTEVFNGYLSGFQNTCEQLEAQKEKCTTKELVDVRKVMGMCVRKHIDLFDMNDKEFTKALANCVDEKLTPMAESGNVYAIYTHVDMSEEVGKESKFKDKLDEYKDSDAYMLMKECQY